MKHLRETFTDQEFKELKEAKTRVGFNWHDFIMLLRYSTQVNALVSILTEPHHRDKTTFLPIDVEEFYMQ